MGKSSARSRNWAPFQCNRECHKCVVLCCGTRKRSGIDRVLFEVFQVDKLERRDMCRFKHNTRRHASFQGLSPSQSTQAPAISWPESRETPFRVGGREVVPDMLGEGQKFFGHFGAYQVQADIVRPGVATSVAKKASQRFVAAILQVSAKHVFRHEYFRKCLEGRERIGGIERRDAVPHLNRPELVATPHCRMTYPKRRGWRGKLAIPPHANYDTVVSRSAY